MGGGGWELPQLELKAQILNYKQYTMFGCVSVTTKLNCRLHIDNLITEARKRLNFLKLVHRPGVRTHTKSVPSFARIFSQIKVDLLPRSFILFPRSTHTPKEIAKHQQ